MADDGDNNVIDFPRIGFTPPGGAGSGPAFPGPSDDALEAPAQYEAESAGPPVRRSPLDTLAGLPAPVPPLPTGAPMPPADTPEGAGSGGMLQPGFVPEALGGPASADASERESAGIGALSMAAVLAVAVAALRGIHTAVSNRRATREQRQAVSDATRRGSRTNNGSAGTGGTGTGGGRGGGGGGRRNIPSSQDWARRTLGRTGPGGGRSGNGGGTSPNRRNNTSGPDRKSTGNRNDPPGRRRNTGPNSPKKPGGLFSRNTSSKDSPGGGRSDRKDRDRARRERINGVHKPTQSGDTGSRVRLRRRNKTSPDTTDASTRGAGGKGRGGRTKSPTGTSRPKGTLRPPKNSPHRNSRKNPGGPKSKATGTGKPTKFTKAGKSGGPQQRVGLGEAISAEAERRLRKRRKHMTPAVSVAKKHKRKDKSRPGKTGTTSSSAPTSTGPTTPKAGKMKWKRGRKGPAAPGRPTSPWAGARRRIRVRWTKRRAAWTGGGTYSAGPSGGRRHSPFEAAGMAAEAAYGTTYTVERADNPGDQERRWEAKPPRARPAAAAIPPPRPAAAAPPEAGPAAAAPTSTKGAGMSLPANTTPGFNLAPSMSAEHTTEVTLDDTLDVLEKLTGQSFGAHDESVRLAAKARQLRGALEDLAIDLLSRHNILGQLTGAAMARLAESMEVLSRKADEMAVSSLAAAELSEAAEQAMFDAYKPVQQATADAGLAVPSARVHNEG